MIVAAPRRRAVDRPQLHVRRRQRRQRRRTLGRPTIIAIANRNAHIVVAETLGFQLRTRSIRGTVGSLGNFDLKKPDRFVRGWRGGVVVKRELVDFAPLSGFRPSGRQS